MRSYDYCIVDSVTENKIFETTFAWVAHCRDGPDVVFSRMIRPDDGIYYTGYTENNDSTTVHGYIKTIEEILP